MTMRRLHSACIAGALVILAACSNPEAARQKAFESGNQYFDQKQYAEAIVEYRNAVRADAKFGEARFKLAEAYEATDDARAAFGEYVRAADLMPENTDVQLKAVTYMLLAGRFEDAQARVKRVLEREPNNVQALAMLGNSLAGLKDLDGAIKEVQQAIDLDPSRAGTYTNLGSLRLAQGNMDQARAAFQKAVEVQPKSVNARLALANFQWGTGDVAAAEQTYRAAIAIEPSNALANKWVASFFMGTGRPIEAESYMKILAESEGPPATVALADYYLVLRRLDAAKALLNPLVVDEKNPLWSEAEVRLAQIAYVEKRQGEASALLEKVLTKDPKNPPALLVRARWLSNDGKTEAALDNARAAVAADPQSAAAFYMLGTLQVRSRDLEGAVKSFEEVLKINPRAADAQLQLSALTLARGNAAAAVEFAQAAAKNDPGSPAARLGLARGLLVQRQIARADTEIASLLKDFPNAAPVHALSGTLRATKRDVAGARREYERTMELDATSMEALTGLVLLDVAEKNVARARGRVDARLAVQPDRSDLLALAARVYATGGDMAKAERTLRHLIEVDPAGNVGYAMLGQIYIRQQKLNDAKAEFEQRIKVNPKDVSAHTMVGMILEAQRNLPDAKKKYDEVLGLDARSVVASNNLAYIYADAGENLDRALQLAQAAVDQVPDSPEIRDTLGWVYYKKDLPQLAVQEFEQSLAKDSGNPVFHYHLGLAYSKNGDYGRARRSFEAALKIKPDYADAQRALKSLVG